jgi:serine palmitoyltransferase
VLASQDRAQHALHTHEVEEYENDTSSAAPWDRSTFKLSSSSGKPPLPPSFRGAVSPKSGSARRRETTKASYSSSPKQHDEEPQIPWLIAYTCYLGYAVLILLGHVRDFCALLFGGRFRKKSVGAAVLDRGYPSEDRSRYASLLKSWEHFYTRRLYTRIQDCFNRPIASSPAASAIDVVERISRNGQKSMQLYGQADQPGTVGTYCSTSSYFVTTYDGMAARRCLNLGSYNYLGFADDWHATCSRAVKATLAEFPVSAASSLAEYGRTDLHDRMEEAVAKFVGKEDAICLNMGFNTNATTIPSLAGPGDLVISDELNHTSIVNGARGSGAAIRIFRHNKMDDLEEILREAIIMGKPRTRRPWNKIIVIVEGIYSMEGSYCDLKNVVRLCKKYGAYVYLDEAHSIGAMGVTGRGCAEYAGVDPADIDIMMGTFTKSFGAMGGYIAASRETIAFLRKRCAGSVFHNSLSPVVCQQVLSALKVRASRLDVAMIMPS